MKMSKEYYTNTVKELYEREVEKDRAEGKTSTRFQIGMVILERYAKIHRRGLIKKSEYNGFRTAIEENLFFY